MAITYRVIPQVEFDKAVQKVLSAGVSRTPAENIVMSFWKASIDLKQDFKVLIEKATETGKLDVSQAILDHINTTLPDTIKYNKIVTTRVSPIAAREF